MPTDDELDEHEGEINREIEEDFPARFRGEDKTKKLVITDADGNARETSKSRFVPSFFPFSPVG